MKFAWDYITLGSNGFAQVGRLDYTEKQLSEKAVLMQHMKENFPIPEDLQQLCFYQWKSFPHDFGTYHELVLCYDRDFIDSISEDSDDQECELVSQFWNFVHNCEREEPETEKLTEKISKYYETHFIRAEKPVSAFIPESAPKRDFFLETLDVLNLDPERQDLIQRIHSGKLDPAAFKSCQRWINQCYNRPKEYALRMCAYNEILQGLGIEAHYGEWQNGYWCDIEFTYVNMGDSYSLTIIHHRDKGWMVGTIGDLVEVFN